MMAAPSRTPGNGNTVQASNAISEIINTFTQTQIQTALQEELNDLNNNPPPNTTNNNPPPNTTNNNPPPSNTNNNPPPNTTNSNPAPTNTNNNPPPNTDPGCTVNCEPPPSATPVNVRVVAAAGDLDHAGEFGVLEGRLTGNYRCVRRPKTQLPVRKSTNAITNASGVPTRPRQIDPHADRQSGSFMLRHAGPC